MKLAFLFRTAPHGNAISREGLDALLAATAFCDEEDIGVFFIDDGVLNSALSVPLHSTNTICKQNNSLFLLKKLTALC